MVSFPLLLFCLLRCRGISCDTLENVSKRALGLMSQAALYAITKLGKAENLREWLADDKAVLL